MLRRRLAAAALAGVMAALFAMPGVASGTQAGEQTVSDYLKVKPGKFKAGKAYTVAVFGQLTDVKAALLTDDMSRPANSKSKVRLLQAIPGEAGVDLARGSISSLVAVGGIGEKAELLDIRDAAAAVSAAGFAVQQRRSSG
jgi:hypothetical protein